MSRKVNGYGAEYAYFLDTFYNLSFRRYVYCTLNNASYFCTKTEVYDTYTS